MKILHVQPNNFNQALWLSISYVCSMAVGIVSSAILSRYFDKVEYGTYKQIMYVYHILFTVFQAGLPAVFTYFLPRYGENEGKYIIKKINGLLFALGTICSLVLFLTSGLLANLLKNPELAVGLKIFSLFPLFTLPTLGVEGIYTVHKNTKFIAFYNIITRLLMLACIVLPVVFIKNDYRYALVGWGIASFFTFVIAIIAKERVYKKVHEIEIPNLYRDVLNYTLPIMGSALIIMAFNSASQLFISRYYGPISFAEYSNGYMALPFVTILVAPVRILLTPIFAQASSSGDYSSPLATLYNSTKELLVLVMPLIVFSFIYAHEIMQFLYGDGYVNSYIYFRIILIFNFVEMFPFSVILCAIGKSKPCFYFDIICTIMLWLIDIVIVFSGVGNPYLISAVFVLMNVCTKYLLPGIFLYNKQNISVINADTIQCMIKVLIHTSITVIVIYSALNWLCVITNTFIILCIALVLYYLLLIITSRLVKINYLQALLKFKR